MGFAATDERALTILIFFCSYATDSTSLVSSVNEYVFENGRRYHSYFGVDKNLMPTDEKEQDR
jgi:hypothetical protein